jgi:hypothetical protein
MSAHSADISAKAAKTTPPPMMNARPYGVSNQVQ